MRKKRDKSENDCVCNRKTSLIGNFDPFPPAMSTKRRKAILRTSYLGCPIHGEVLVAYHCRRHGEARVGKRADVQQQVPEKVSTVKS